MKKENRKTLKHKVLSIRMANGFLHNIMDDVLNNLEELNVFRNPIIKDIESNFISQITSNAFKKNRFLQYSQSNR